MKKRLLTIIALASAIAVNAQVSNRSTIDSKKAAQKTRKEKKKESHEDRMKSAEEEFLEFERQMGKEFEEYEKQVEDNFEEERRKAIEEYEEYKRKVEAEFEAYANSVKQTWGEDNFVDDTKNQWVEYSDDYKSRSIVDFESGDVTIEVALDDVDENDTNEIEKRLAEAIERMLESKGNSTPYNTKSKGNDLTKEPILDGLVDLSKYEIEKSDTPATAPADNKNKNTPPAPTLRGGNQPQTTSKSGSTKAEEKTTAQNDAAAVAQQKEIEKKKKEEETKRAEEQKKKQDEARQRAEEKKKQDEARQRAEEKKKQEEARAKQQAEEKKKQEEARAKQQAEEKKKQEEARAKQQAESKKKKEEASAKEIAKAVAKQSAKTVSTVKGEDKKERKVVAVQMTLVSNNLSKKASIYKDYVSTYSKKFNVEEPLIFAVIEQESSFNPEAKSWVPAYGLMQLVPKSGGVDAYQYVYKKQWIPTMEYLYVPHQNIELGTAYLCKLMEMFKGVKDVDCRRLCAIASYNTGAGNVSRAFTGKTSIKEAVQIINTMSYNELYDHLTKKLSTEEARKYVSGVSRRRENYIKK